MKLRTYQQDVKNRVYAAWQQGARNVCAVMPTGAGKTVLFSDICHDNPSMATCVIAHRQELLQQISLALGRFEVRHQLICPRPVRKRIVNHHMTQLGHSYVDASSPIAVAGVKTLINRDLGPWAKQVALWVMDECHHILQGNQWGTAVDLFPNAYGLGVTATPCRADGKGLGRDYDGVLDELVVGPTMRDLINQGHLCDYRIMWPQCRTLDLSNVETDATGDYKKKQLQAAVEKSQIVGDVVKEYKRFANGKRGVTFVNSTDTAAKVAQAYCSAGVPAEVVTAKTPDHMRGAIIDRFSRGELLNLVNVDLFGEGFDLPAIECVSFARPTQSYGLYVQQFGRALRVMEGKEKAIIIDHVGNVNRHRLPDVPREWSLAPRPKRSKQKKQDDEIPLTSCPECANVYERIHSECPFCGFKPEPQTRSDPEHVDGDLIELSPEVLAEMRGEADRLVGEARVPQHLPAYAQAACHRRHEERKEAQLALRKSLEYWVGQKVSDGRSQSQTYRLFFHRFGTDAMSAQALGRKEAVELANEINLDIGRGHRDREGVS